MLSRGRDRGYGGWGLGRRVGRLGGRDKCSGGVVGRLDILWRGEGTGGVVGSLDTLWRGEGARVVVGCLDTFWCGEGIGGALTACSGPRQRHFGPGHLAAYGLDLTT